jgi:endonuclease/exonuclease/phosphatase family metal-dependent hydrolase
MLKMFRFISFNTNCDSSSVLDAFEEVADQVDLICLQEIHEYGLQLLSDALSMPYRHFGACHGNFGNAIISRLPLVHCENHVVRVPNAQSHDRSCLYAQVSLSGIAAANGTEKTSEQRFSSNIEELSETQKKTSSTNSHQHLIHQDGVDIAAPLLLHLFVTHLDNKHEQVRLQQWQLIQEWMNEVMVVQRQQSTVAALVCGDFNAFQRSDYDHAQWMAIEKLFSQRQWDLQQPLVIDAVTSSPNNEKQPSSTSSSERPTLPIQPLLDLASNKSAPTYPTDSPLLRIDYFFANRTFVESTFKVHHCGPLDELENRSDHLPMELVFSQRDSALHNVAKIDFLFLRR